MKFPEIINNSIEIDVLLCVVEPIILMTRLAQLRHTDKHIELSIAFPIEMFSMLKESGVCLANNSELNVKRLLNVTNVVRFQLKFKPMLFLERNILFCLNRLFRIFKLNLNQFRTVVT